MTNKKKTVHTRIYEDDIERLHELKAGLQAKLERDLTLADTINWLLKYYYNSLLSKSTGVKRLIKKDR